MIGKMLQKVAQNIAERWLRLGYAEQKNVEWYRHGLEIVISGIIGISMILLAGILLGQWFHALMFLAVFVPLLQFTGGYHANAYWKCHSTFLLIFLFNILFVSILPEDFAWTLIGVVLFWV